VESVKAWLVWAVEVWASSVNWIDVGLSLGITLMSISCIGIIHCSYQMKRNREVYDIRTEWILSNDDRLHKYTYDDMYEPNKHNWFGLKFTKAKHYTCDKFLSPTK
jgi:hypothetical protein